MTEKRKPGRPAKIDAKEAITLRLDPALLAEWKATGTDWRTRMAAQIRSPSNPEHVCKAQRPKEKPAAKVTLVKSPASPPSEPRYERKDTYPEWMKKR